jgi:hypothetical protein
MSVRNELEYLTGTVERARAQYDAACERLTLARVVWESSGLVYLLALHEGRDTEDAGAAFNRATNDLEAAHGARERARYILDDEQRAFEAGHVNTRGAKRRTTERTLRAVAEATRAAVAEYGPDVEALEDIDALADRVAKALQKTLAPELGFALLLFKFGPAPAPNAYRSNADNRCMAAGLRQLADRLDPD